MSEEKKQSSIQTLHAQMQDVEVALFAFTGATEGKERKKAGKEFRKTMKFLKRGISAAYQESLEIEKGKKSAPEVAADTADGAKVCLASEPAEGPQGEPAVLVELEVIEAAAPTSEPEQPAPEPAIESPATEAAVEPEVAPEPAPEPSAVDAAPIEAAESALPPADISVEAVTPVAEPPSEPQLVADAVSAAPVEGGEAA